MKLVSTNQLPVVLNLKDVKRDNPNALCAYEAFLLRLQVSSQRPLLDPENTWLVFNPRSGHVVIVGIVHLIDSALTVRLMVDLMRQDSVVACELQILLRSLKRMAEDFHLKKLFVTAVPEASMIVPSDEFAFTPIIGDFRDLFGRQLTKWELDLVTKRPTWPFEGNVTRLF